MNAARLAIVALLATLVLAAVRATASEMQPSAERVLVTSVFALIAPLFWPGKSAGFGRTVLTVAAWSFAVSLLALFALSLWGGPGHTLARSANVCAMLLLIMLVAHAVAAALEALLAPSFADAPSTRHIAGSLAVLLLVLLASAPLWLGPTAELVSDAALLDASLAVSPLTHLAVASGNDLLRNQWFYQHSNLAALRYSYPALMTVTGAYIALVLAFAVVPLAIRRAAQTLGSTTSHLTTERAP